MRLAKFFGPTAGVLAPPSCGAAVIAGEPRSPDAVTRTIRSAHWRKAGEQAWWPSTSGSSLRPSTVGLGPGLRRLPAAAATPTIRPS